MRVIRIITRLLGLHFEFFVLIHGRSFFPFRTLLLIEHSDLVIIAAASALFSSTGGPAKVSQNLKYVLKKSFT